MQRTPGWQSFAFERTIACQNKPFPGRKPWPCSPKQGWRGWWQVPEWGRVPAARRRLAGSPTGSGEVSPRLCEDGACGGGFQPRWDRGRTRHGAQTHPPAGIWLCNKSPNDAIPKTPLTGFPWVAGSLPGGRGREVLRVPCPVLPTSAPKGCQWFALLFPTAQPICVGISSQAPVQGNGCRPPTTPHHLPRRQGMLLGLRKTFPRCSPRGQIKPPRDHPCWHRNRMSAPDSPPAKISLSNADLVYGWDI